MDGPLLRSAVVNLRPDWLIVGPPPGEQGGVATSATASVAWFRAVGDRVGTGSVRPLPRLVRLFLGPESLAPRRLYHCSSLRSLRVCSFQARLGRPVTTALFVHGGRAAEALIRLSDRSRQRLLQPFVHVWVTNQQVATELADRLSSTQASRLRVVAPIDVADVADLGRPKPGSSAKQRLLVAVGGSETLYGLACAFEVLDRVRAIDEEAHLVVLAYGDADRTTLSKRCRRPGVQLLIDPAPDRVEHELRLADVVLRPTETDGDSVLVRQALELGGRVVASDVVPRPRGCEVASMHDFVSAVLYGGKTVTADRLGEPLGGALDRLRGQTEFR